MKQEQLLPLLGKEVRALVSIAGGRPYGINGIIRHAANQDSLPIGICCDEDNKFIIGDNIVTVVRKPGFIVLLVLAMGSYQPIFSEDDGLMFFDTEVEAKAEIDDCIAGVKEAVAAGDMSDEYSVDDYTVAPAILDDTTITCSWRGCDYTMDRSEDDWHTV